MADEVFRLLALARQQQFQSNYKLAIETAKQALKLDPESYDIHENLMDSYYELYRHTRKKQDLKNAYEHAQSSHRLNPENSHPYSTCALILYAMGKDKLAKAKAEKAIQLDPENPDYYRIASSVHQKKYIWNKTDSIKYLKKALELEPNDIDLLVSIADYYYYQEGNLSKAEEYLKSALAIDPTENEALITMGHILYKQGKRHEAKELAMIAVSNTPDYIEALRLLCLSTIPRYSLTGMSYRMRIWLAKPGRWPVIILLIFSRLGIFFYLFMLFSGSLLEKKVKRKYMKEINLKKGF